MFKLVLMEGKGAGLVALRDIVAGTLLVSESPALRVTLLGGDLSPMAAVDVSRQFCRSVGIPGETKLSLYLSV